MISVVRDVSKKKRAGVFQKTGWFGCFNGTGGLTCKWTGWFFVFQYTSLIGCFSELDGCGYFKGLAG